MFQHTTFWLTFLGDLFSCIPFCVLWLWSSSNVCVSDGATSSTCWKPWELDVDFGWASTTSDRHSTWFWALLLVRDSPFWTSVRVLAPLVIAEVMSGLWLSGSRSWPFDLTNSSPSIWPFCNTLSTSCDSLSFTRQSWRMSFRSCDNFLFKSFFVQLFDLW